MPASSRIKVVPASTKNKLSGQAIYVPVFSDEKPEVPAALNGRGSKAASLLKDYLKSVVVGESPGICDSVYLGHGQPDRIVLMSLGPKSMKRLDVVRVAGAAMGKHMAQLKLKQAGVLTAVLEDSFDGPVAEAFTEGLFLGDFRYDEHLSSKSKIPARTLQLLSRSARQGKAQTQGIRRARIRAEAANLARTISHQPPNQLHPVRLAGISRELARQYGLQCTILDEKQMARRRMGGMLCVGQGSAVPPRLIVLRTRGAARRAPVVIVGKAITFDTGGYSLKPSSGMLGMKYDKCGGINTLAILTAAAQLRPRVPVIGVIAAAENMVSSKGYRPNDIIRMYSGKTVEVTNTDAEGRLVLADALTYAQRTYSPQTIIDMATLTGGASIALGTQAAALFSDDDALADQLTRSGENTHERLWRLPMWADYDALLKGTDADLINSSKERAAHCIQGAIFLKQFIEPKTPWAHIDIAATGITEKDLPYCPQGATGFGVRLVLDYLCGL